jgi:hypothetical protein
VGIIRRIIRVITNQGRISDITYDGWGATGKGAEELKARHWRTDLCNLGACVKGYHYPRGTQLRAFCAIHIIGLIPEPNEVRRGVLISPPNKCRL